MGVHRMQGFSSHCLIASSYPFRAVSQRATLFISVLRKERGERDLIAIKSGFDLAER